MRHVELCTSHTEKKKKILVRDHPTINLRINIPVLSWKMKKTFGLWPCYDLIAGFVRKRAMHGLRLVI